MRQTTTYICMLHVAYYLQIMLVAIVLFQLHMGDELEVPIAAKLMVKKEWEYDEIGYDVTKILCMMIGLISALVTCFSE
jgi:hypothetical protein